MKIDYWKMRGDLQALYADTLKNIASRLGCDRVRGMNKGQLADYIVRVAKNLGDTPERDWIFKCIDECDKVGG